MGLGKQESLPFEEENKKPIEFYRESEDEKVFCRVCQDQEGGCPQCGFGRERQKKKSA